MESSPIRRKLQSSAVPLWQFCSDFTFCNLHATFCLPLVRISRLLSVGFSLYFPSFPSCESLDTSFNATCATCIRFNPCRAIISGFRVRLLYDSVTVRRDNGVLYLWATLLRESRSFTSEHFSTLHFGRCVRQYEIQKRWRMFTPLRSNLWHSPVPSTRFTTRWNILANLKVYGQASSLYLCFFIYDRSTASF